MSERIPKNQIRTRNSIEQHEHEDDADARRVVPVDETGEFFGTPGNPINTTAVINPVAGVDTPNIYNVSAPLANTEYSQLLPDGTRHLLIKVRGNDAILKLAFNSGDTSSKWITVGLGNGFYLSDVDLTGASIYFQTDKASKIIEILSWS